MRHPVSTPRSFEQNLRAAVTSRVVGFALNPCARDHAQPGTGEYAYGVRVIAATQLGFCVDIGGPGVGVARVVGQTGNGCTQAVVAGPAKCHRLGLARGIGHGSYASFGGPSHTQRSNDGIVLVVMIETAQGVANAAQIAAVDGVDAVFVGPNDLAHNLGCENRWNEPVVQAAIEETLRAVAAAGKCPGILALTPQDEDRYAAWGARYFATVSTGIITRALKDAAQGGRAPINY